MPNISNLQFRKELWLLEYCMAAIRKPQKALYVTMWGTVSRFDCYVCIQYVHMYKKQPMCCVQEALRKLAQNHQIITNRIVLGMRNIPYLEWGGNRHNTLDPLQPLTLLTVEHDSRMYCWQPTGRQPAPSGAFTCRRSQTPSSRSCSTMITRGKKYPLSLSS